MTYDYSPQLGKDLLTLLGSLRLLQETFGLFSRAPLWDMIFFKDHGSLFLPLSLVGHEFGKKHLFPFSQEKASMQQYDEGCREKSW